MSDAPSGRGPEAPTPSLACPACGTVGSLSSAAAGGDGMVRCECGHLAYAGYVAEADALQQRLGWLSDRIAASDPAPPAEFARRYGVWPASRMTTSGTATTGEAGRPTGPTALGTQTLLLTLGAALLLIAATVFAAVNWHRLGAAGQAALLGVATATVAGTAITLKRRLSATAEALAVVAVGLAVIDIIGASALGLVPEDWLSGDRGYLPVTFAALCAITVAGADRYSMGAWRWLGVAAAVVAAGLTTRLVGSLAGESRSSWAAALGLTAAVGVCLAVASSRVPRDWQRPCQIGGIAGLLAAIAAVQIGIADHGAVPGAIATVGLTGIGLALAAAAATAPEHRSTLFAVAGVASGAVVGLLVRLPNEPQENWLGAVAGLAGGVALVAVGRRWGVPAGASPAAAVWATWGLAELASLADDRPAIEVQRPFVWLTGAAAISLLAGSRLIPGTAARRLAWPAAISGSAAWLLAEPSSAPDLLESRTIPCALLLACAGALAHGVGGGRATTRRTFRPNSLVALGPAVSVAIVPSAIATWSAPWVTDNGGQSTGHLIRLLVVLFSGVALISIGSLRRLAGLFVPAAAAVAITAAAQIWTGAIALPRWTALAIAGVVLVASGARVEWLRQRGRIAQGWLESLG